MQTLFSILAVALYVAHVIDVLEERDKPKTFPALIGGMGIAGLIRSFLK